MSVSRLLRSGAPYQGLEAEARTNAPSSAARLSLAAVAVRSVIESSTERFRRTVVAGAGASEVSRASSCMAR